MFNTERWKKNSPQSQVCLKLLYSRAFSRIMWTSNSLVLVQWQASEAERNSLKDVGGMRRLEKGRRDQSQMQELQFVLKIILLGMDSMLMVYLKYI